MHLSGGLQLQTRRGGPDHPAGRGAARTARTTTPADRALAEPPGRGPDTRALGTRARRPGPAVRTGTHGPQSAAGGGAPEHLPGAAEGQGVWQAARGPLLRDAGDPPAACSTAGRRNHPAFAREHVRVFLNGTARRYRRPGPGAHARDRSRLLAGYQGPTAPTGRASAAARHLAHRGRPPAPEPGYRSRRCRRSERRPPRLYRPAPGDGRPAAAGPWPRLPHPECGARGPASAQDAGR